MDSIVLTRTLPTPVGQPIGVGSDQEASLVAGLAGGTQPHVLVCAENAGVRELISLLLADAGYSVMDIDMGIWLDGNALEEPHPAVVILDAWPLRQAEAAARAYAHLAQQSAAVVLLVDSPSPPHLVAQFGAVALLPLIFSLHDLVTAVQHGCSRPADGSSV